MTGTYLRARIEEGRVLGDSVGEGASWVLEVVGSEIGDNDVQAGAGSAPVSCSGCSTQGEHAHDRQSGKDVETNGGHH